MKVKVEYLGHIKEMLGSNRFEEVEMRDESTVAGLLSILSEKYGDMFKKAIYDSKEKSLKADYLVIVNGYLLNQRRGIETKLKNGDRITLLPTVNGG